MSGVVGIVNLDGAPVDVSLLWAMTRRLADRGPDAQHVWSDGRVGFGHTLLSTTPGAADGCQPETLDGQVFICADARLDRREELRQRLNAAGCVVADHASDAALILHAYCLWRQACLDHLFGDFCFAIWDGTAQSLFCARDHFGVRPFFYAQVGNTLVFANDLRAIRRHPAVTAQLNETAIADFLLFEQHLDTDATAFADIRRLPPAHTLTLRQRTVSVRRYWTLPCDPPTRLPSHGEYVERFMELFRHSVADRLGASAVGVMMSGGLDSTSIAAVANRLLKEQSNTPSLTAYTLVYDRLIPDQERRFAELAAQSLGIPIRYQALDDYALFAGWDNPSDAALCLPEPADISLRQRTLDFVGQVWQGERVMLSGFGGDPLLYPEPTHLARSLRHGDFLRFVGEAARFALRYRRPPPLYLRSSLLRGNVQRREMESVPFPEWIQPAWAARLQLQERWRRFNTEMELPSDPGPTERPTAYRQLSITLWPTVFETYDSVQLGGAYEVRHPFFDLRLARFLLSTPPLPWCVNKTLLREAMTGLLPPEVRLRPKAPLAGAPFHPPAVHVDRQWLRGQLADLATLTEYVRIDAVLNYDIWSGAQQFEQHLSFLRVLSLAYWLRHCR